MAKIPQAKPIAHKKKNRVAWPRLSSLNLDIELGNKISDSQKERLFYDLFNLLDAGADLLRSVQIQIGHTSKKHIKAFLQSVHDNLVKGDDLYTAFRKNGQFTPFETYSIKIGEETGRLPRVLEALAVHFKERVALRRLLFEALSYPIFILLTTIFIVGFMLTIVVPMFKDMFIRMGAELPAITKWVLAVSETLTGNTWLVLVLTFLICAAVGFAFRNGAIRHRFQGIIIKMPYLGGVILQGHIYRWTQVMQLMAESSIPLETALELSHEMIQFHPLKREIILLREGIRRGDQLADILSKSRIFPSDMVVLIEIGEETNRLDSMYAKINQQQKDKIQYRTKLVSKILEPVMIVIIGALVGFILVAMYLPIFELSTVVQ
jgi:type IV pilus assembly protein PilC